METPTPRETGPAAAVPASTRARGRFAACAAGFAAAAAAVAIIQAIEPFARGWWLVAYLALVGGAAQALLGPGLIALRSRLGAGPAGTRAAGAQLMLWNAGTAIVAAADLAAATGAVVAGSVLLLVALALFARDLRAATAGARQPRAGWAAAYALLLALLAVSVLIGTLLAFTSHS